MLRYKRMLTIVLFFLSVTGSAVSQEFPEFDGVYLRMKNDTFVELQPVSWQSYGVSAEEQPQPQSSSGGYRPKIFNPTVGFVNGLPVSALPSTVVDASGIKSVFVRSRNLKLLRVTSLLTADVAFGPSSAAAGYNTILRGDNGDFSREQMAATVVNVSCTHEADAFKLLNNSENSFEYFPRFDGLFTASASVTSNLFSRSGENICQNVSPKVGMIVETTSGSYVVVFLP